MFFFLLSGWAAGVATGDLFGGNLHFLLLAAVALLLLDTLTSGRRTPAEARVAERVPRRERP